MSVEPASGYAPVNDLEMYWESRGEGGVPLVVIHGGYGHAGVFGGLLDRLAERRQVVAIDLQGHGHTRDINRPFRYEGFADDIAGLIGSLGLGRSDLLGYSLGATASLRCTIQHPAVVRRLALVSIPCRRDGWYPEVRAAFDQMSSAGLEMMRQTPIYASFEAVAPDPGAFGTLMDKTGDLQRQPYDWSQEVRQITSPTLLVYGDADSIPATHAAEFFALLGGGLRDGGFDGTPPTSMRLAVLPGMTHYNIFSSRQLLPVLEGFLG